MFKGTVVPIIPILPEFFTRNMAFLAAASLIDQATAAARHGMTNTWEMPNVPLTNENMNRLTGLLFHWSLVISLVMSLKSASRGF